VSWPLTHFTHVSSATGSAPRVPEGSNDEPDLESGSTDDECEGEAEEGGVGTRRVKPSGHGVFSFKGVCAVLVPVRPQEFTDDVGAERAIISVFEEKVVGPADAAGTGGAPAALLIVESSTG
jgi:hypothetical protein